MADLVINGVDVATLGYTVRMPPGWRSGPAVQIEAAPAADRPGARVSRRQVGTRTVRIQGLIGGEDLADLHQNLSRLLWLAESERPSRFIFGDDPGWFLEAELEDHDARPTGSAAVPLLWQLDLVVTAHEDPYWQAVAETEVTGIGDSDVELPQGTAPVRPIVSIAGPATDPVLTLKNHLGAPVGMLAFEIEVAGGQFLVIDHDLETVYENDTGNPNEGTKRFDARTDGWFFAVEPAHSNYLTSAWPTLRCSSGTATARYRRRRR